MKCENCGYVANPGDRICLNCGAKLPEANAIIKGLETIQNSNLNNQNIKNKNMIYITIGGILLLIVIVFIVIKVFVLKK